MKYDPEHLKNCELCRDWQQAQREHEVVEAAKEWHRIITNPISVYAEDLMRAQQRLRSAVEELALSE